MEFENIFKNKKPIIGMIHLSGNKEEKIKRALEELEIYEEEGIDGAIVEDYHGTPEEVHEVLKQSLRKFNIVKGINILRNPYSTFELAQRYEANFVQFDSVQTSNLKLGLYEKLRREFPNIAVLGGVGFKYIPTTGNPLETDLREGKSRCEAIVTTGDGTGIETPLGKLILYKNILEEFPLIVGAGINAENAYEQLKITNGAIVGSYFKSNGNTHLKVERERVRELVKIRKSLK